MVLGGKHGPDGGPIGEGQERDFRAAEALLDDHLGPRGAKLTLDQHALQASLGVGARFGQHHTFARRQTRGFDDHGVVHLIQVAQRGREVGKNSEARRGDVVARHELLGKRLGGFDFGCHAARPEHRQPRGAEHIGDTRRQGRLGADDHQVHLLLAGESRQGGTVLGGHRQVGPQLSRAGVARRDPQLL